MPKNNPNSIASVVGGRPELDGKSCADSLNRLWTIHQKHSGCYLIGKNVEACIPYWTCYFISLPELKVVEKPFAKPIYSETPTLLEELLRLSVKTGDLIKDERFGLLWLVNVGECGLNLEGYDDNHSMSTVGLGVLSFGKLEKLSTKYQRDARKLERLV